MPGTIYHPSKTTPAANAATSSAANSCVHLGEVETADEEAKEKGEKTGQRSCTNRRCQRYC